MAAQLFGNAGREHMEKYGTKPEHFAKENSDLRLLIRTLSYRNWNDTK